MKKSEMLQLMVDIIHGFRRSTEGVTSVELGEMVLRMQEELGMLPPIRGNKSAFNTVFEEIDPTWEPEDAKSVEGEGHYILYPEDFDKLIGEDND